MTHSSRRTVAGTLNASTCSRLLVSVRSADEAVQAIAGGADILDIKEPDHGSLGMADVSVIRAIAEQLHRDGESIPLSVALGELRDWIGRDDIPAIPAEVQFAKLGLSELADVPEWRAEWRRVRDLFDQQRAAPLTWVAVAYADESVARSPALNDVLIAAGADPSPTSRLSRSHHGEVVSMIDSSADCVGVLIDTYAKTGRTLIDCLSLPRLREVADRCHAAEMFLAVAGSLTIAAIQRLSSIDADIIAIRSAACRHGNRRQPIDPTLVAEVCQAMRRATNVTSGPSPF